MTNQEVFDKVAAHLLTQGARSTSARWPYKGGVCAYRGEGGLKCAIGCLIAEEDYSPTIEGLGVHSRRVFTAAKLHESQISLASTLQTIHDTHSPTEWPRLLENAAATYQLAYGVVK